MPSSKLKAFRRGNSIPARPIIRGIILAKPNPEASRLRDHRGPCMVNMRFEDLRRTNPLCACINWIRIIPCFDPARSLKNHSIYDVQNAHRL